MTPLRIGVSAIFAAMLFFAAPAKAQYLDARLVPKGMLRVSFQAHYFNYNQRFAFGNADLLDGTPEPLGFDLSADTVGSNLFPTVRPAEEAIRSLLGDATYRINVGVFQTIRDADIRRFPFQFGFGITDRLTVSATIPLVTTRSQVDFSLDSTDANVGFNLANPMLADAATSARAAALISQLSQSIAVVEALISGGSFGCPSSVACDNARATVSRANMLITYLFDIAGLVPGGEFVPFAPLANSPAGLAMIAQITGIADELQALGGSSVTEIYPLPTERLGSEDIDRLLTDAGMGFAASPLAFNRQTKLGDIEVAVRLGLITSTALRVVLSSTLRLPTGTPSSADNFVDIGTGDKQMDLELGAEAALESSSGIGLSMAGSYTLQLPHELVRRVTTPDAPLVPVERRTLVTRDLGNVLQLHAFPTIRLAQTIRVFASVTYFRQAASRFTLPANSQFSQPVEQLSRETEMQSLSFGGGLAYRSDMTMSGRTVPIEAGLNYRAAFTGSGGLTPKTNSMHVYLRLFYKR